MLCSRLLLLILVFTPFFVLAHTDISETIKALTTRIEAKPTADLYYQRGTEFRALQQKAHAIEDLESALKIELHNRHALVALVQLYETNKRAKALISRYQKFAKTKEEKFEAHYLLASYNAKLGLFEQASSQCDTLHLIRPSEDPALDLFHAGLLLKLQRPNKAATILKKSLNRTKSIVVRNNWIDAALTAGQTKTVLPIIEKELSSSRFRSSWLIRRARASLILKRKEAAQADLREALVEIAPRINPERPDFTLIADRGLIHALMGNKTLAKNDLEILKKSGYSPNAYHLLSSALAEQ
jgi:tetratricopeptide (TPR) repeat protein